MSNAWPDVPLGEVLVRSEQFVDLVPTEQYKEVTIRLWGKGVVLRGIVTGSDIAAARRIVVRAGQFIFSRIDARNGALGLVPDDLDGAVVSSDFPAYNLVEARLDRGFMNWFSRTAQFVDLCRTASEGTTNRVRLQEDRFLGMSITLPPLSEQRRIVAKIEQLASKIEEARGLRDSLATRTQGLLASAAMEVFPTSLKSSVGDYAKVQSGYAFKSEWFTEEGIRLARNVNIGHGTIDWADTAHIPADRKAEFGRFELQAGDILVSLDRPIISTGVKAAQVREEDLPSLLLQRVGRLQFIDDHVDPAYMFHWLQSPCFARAIDPGRSNGVPHISQKDIERIPFAVPPLPEQRRIVAYLDDLQAKVEQLKTLQAQTAAELDALLPSILDRAFRGEL